MTVTPNDTLSNIEDVTKTPDVSFTAATSATSVINKDEERYDDDVGSESASVQNLVTFVNSTSSIDDKTTATTPSNARRKPLPLAPIFDDSGSFTLGEMLEPDTKAGGRHPLRVGDRFFVCGEGSIFAPQGGSVLADTIEEWPLSDGLAQKGVDWSVCEWEVAAVSDNPPISPAQQLASSQQLTDRFVPSWMQMQTVHPRRVVAALERSNPSMVTDKYIEQLLLHEFEADASIKFMAVAFEPYVFENRARYCKLGDRSKAEQSKEQEVAEAEFYQWIPPQGPDYTLGELYVEAKRQGRGVWNSYSDEGDFLSYAVPFYWRNAFAGVVTLDTQLKAAEMKSSERSARISRKTDDDGCTNSQIHSTHLTAAQADQLADSLAQSAINLAAHLAERSKPLDRETLKELGRVYLGRDRRVFGMGIAFEPQAYDNKAAWMTYASHCGKEVSINGRVTKEVVIEEFDGVKGSFYQTNEWYRSSILSSRSLWTAPYYNAHAGKTFLKTFAVPFRLQPSATTANTESATTGGAAGSLSGVVRLDVEYSDALHSFFYYESATGGAAAEEQSGTICSTCGHDTSIAYYQHPVSATRICIRCHSLGLYSGAEKLHYRYVDDARSDAAGSSISEGSEESVEGGPEGDEEGALEFVEACDKYRLCVSRYRKEGEELEMGRCAQFRHVATGKLLCVDVSVSNGEHGIYQHCLEATDCYTQGSPGTWFRVLQAEQSDWDELARHKMAKEAAQTARLTPKRFEHSVSQDDDNEGGFNDSEENHRLCNWAIVRKQMTDSGLLKAGKDYAKNSGGRSAAVRVGGNRNERAGAVVIESMSWGARCGPIFARKIRSYRETDTKSDPGRIWERAVKEAVWRVDNFTDDSEVLVQFRNLLQPWEEARAPIGLLVRASVDMGALSAILKHQGSSSKGKLLACLIPSLHSDTVNAISIKLWQVLPGSIDAVAAVCARRCFNISQAQMERLVEVTFNTEENSLLMKGATAISNVCRRSRRAQRMAVDNICSNHLFLDKLRSGIEGELGATSLLQAQVLVGDLAEHNPETSTHLMGVLDLELSSLLQELHRAMQSCFLSRAEAAGACVAVSGIPRMILTLFVDVCEVGWSRKELASTTYVVDKDRAMEQYASGTIGLTWKRKGVDRTVENMQIDTTDGRKRLLDLLLGFVHRAVYQPEVNDALYAALELIHAVTVNDMYNDAGDRLATVRELIHVASTEQFITGSEEVVQRRVVSGRRCKVEALNVLHSIKDLQLHERVLMVVAGQGAESIGDALMEPGLNLIEKSFKALHRTTDPSLEESLASMLLRLHVTHTELKRSLLRVHYVETGQMDLLSDAQKWTIELARILDEPEIDVLAAARASGQLRASLVPDGQYGLTKSTDLYVALGVHERLLQLLKVPYLGIAVWENCYSTLTTMAHATSYRTVIRRLAREFPLYLKHAEEDIRGANRLCIELLCANKELAAEWYEQYVSSSLRILSKRPMAVEIQALRTLLECLDASLVDSGIRLTIARSLCEMPNVLGDLYGAISRGSPEAMHSLVNQLNTGNPRYYVELLDLLRVCATDDAEAVVVTDSNDVTQTTVETRRKDGRASALLGRVLPVDNMVKLLLSCHRVGVKAALLDFIRLVHTAEAVLALPAEVIAEIMSDFTATINDCLEAYCKQKSVYASGGAAKEGSDAQQGLDDGRASTVLSSCVWLGKHKELATPRAYVFKCIIPFLTCLYHTGGVLDATAKGKMVPVLRALVVQKASAELTARLCECAELSKDDSGGITALSACLLHITDPCHGSMVNQNTVIRCDQSLLSSTITQLERYRRLCTRPRLLRKLGNTEREICAQSDERAHRQRITESITWQSESEQLNNLTNLFRDEGGHYEWDCLNKIIRVLVRTSAAARSARSTVIDPVDEDAAHDDEELVNCQWIKSNKTKFTRLYLKALLPLVKARRNDFVRRTEVCWMLAHLLGSHSRAILLGALELAVLCVEGGYKRAQSQLWQQPAITKLRFLRNIRDVLKLQPQSSTDPRSLIIDIGAASRQYVPERDQWNLVLSSLRQVGVCIEELRQLVDIFNNVKTTSD
ncbi:hypothetical protein FOL47_001749 [Perkinsus chesapeaki]|uniref:Uncharacterized protein n=1 Tax=Perkinsus chesapeaki TaxID=330153 RepID=A0A7J6MIY5_PERCH|nr:hypothetical protein FOL47_001749 [Perkinsus chesapeaki]